MEDFTDKVAVVTGGASGVGRAIAERLGAQGAKLVLADIEAGVLEAAVRELEAAGFETLGVRTDVSDPAAVQALADAAFDRFGGVHLVFNNAGVAPPEGAQKIWELSPNDWEWGIRVNVYGVVNGIRAFVPRLLEQGDEAVVVNTCSGNGGFFALPMTPIYSASKGAVVRISEVLHYHLLGTPVRAAVLFPGPHTVETGLFNASRNRPEDLPREPDAPEIPIKTVDDMREIFSAMGKELQTTQPEEVAEFCVEGIRQGQFWLVPENPDTDAALKTFMQSILDRGTLEPPELL